MNHFETEAECLVRYLDQHWKDEEISKQVGEKLCTIADTDEGQLVELLNNEEALTIFLGLLADVSAAHRSQAYLFWHSFPVPTICCVHEPFPSRMHACSQGRNEKWTNF